MKQQEEGPVDKICVKTQQLSNIFKVRFKERQRTLFFSSTINTVTSEPDGAMKKKLQQTEKVAGITRRCLQKVK